MVPSIDSLLKQLLPVKGSSALLIAAKSGAIDATVLSSKLVSGNLLSGDLLSSKLKPSNLKPGNLLPGKPESALSSANNVNSSSAKSNQQFQILISTGTQRHLLTSKTPIDPGTIVQVKLTKSGLALAVKTNKPAPNEMRNPDAKPVKNTGTLHSQTRPAQSTPDNKMIAAELAKTTAAPANNQSSIRSTQQLIDIGIRQALPVQQPLREIIPKLQNILQRLSQPQLPEQLLSGRQTQQNDRALVNSIKHLLQQIPNVKNIQKPGIVKQTLLNSGIFSEAQQANKNPTKQTNANIPSHSPDRDLKILMQRLVRQLATNAGSEPKSETYTTRTSTAASTASIAIDTADEERTTITEELKPASAQAKTGSTQRASSENLDIALRQLGRQLLASIARTQLNQLESLSGRQSNNTENQGPVNSWSTDIAVINGKHVDNIELRIDQEEVFEENKKQEKDRKKMWTVMLNFDLHALGKMNVQLKVIDKSVSATIWSQMENTHREVKQHIKSLSDNLEKIGISVNQVDCKLGVAPKSNSTLYRQLVDIRT